MGEQAERPAGGLSPVDGLFTLLASLGAALLFSVLTAGEGGPLLFELLCVLAPAVCVLAARRSFRPLFTPLFPLKDLLLPTLLLMTAASVLGFGTGSVLDNIFDLGEVAKLVEGEVLARGAAERVFLFCLLPAVAEELLFRGVVLNSLLGTGRVAAVAVTSVLFAAFHGSVQLFLPILVVSFALSLIGLQKGGLLAAMACHFLHNLVNVAMIGLPGPGPSPGQSIALTLVSALCCAGAAAVFCRRARAC